MENCGLNLKHLHEDFAAEKYFESPPNSPPSGIKSITYFSNSPDKLSQSDAATIGILEESSYYDLQLSSNDEFCRSKIENASTILVPSRRKIKNR